VINTVRNSKYGALLLALLAFFSIFSPNRIQSDESAVKYEITGIVDFKTDHLKWDFKEALDNFEHTGGELSFKPVLFTLLGYQEVTAGYNVGLIKSANASTTRATYIKVRNDIEKVDVTYITSDQGELQADIAITDLAWPDLVSDVLTSGVIQNPRTLEEFKKETVISRLLGLKLLTDIPPSTIEIEVSVTYRGKTSNKIKSILTE